MTVSTTIRKAGPFAGTGLVSSYPFAFKVFTDDDLLVIRTPTGGADVTLVLASDYTVTLNPDQDTVPGGSVVLSAPLAVGYTLSIGSQVDSLQGLSLTNNGGFFPKAIENALDKLDIQDQQQEETLSRAVRVPFGSGAIPDLPAPSAGSALVWNTAGTALENGTPGVAYDTLRSDLAGTGSGQGGHIVGSEDAGGWFGGVTKTVEAILQWLGSRVVHLVGTGGDDSAAFAAAIAKAGIGGELRIYGTLGFPAGTTYSPLKRQTWVGMGAADFLVTGAGSVAAIEFTNTGEFARISNIGFRASTSFTGSAFKFNASLNCELELPLVRNVLNGVALEFSGGAFYNRVKNFKATSAGTALKITGTSPNCPNNNTIDGIDIYGAVGIGLFCDSNCSMFQLNGYIDEAATTVCKVQVTAAAGLTFNSPRWEQPSGTPSGGYFDIVNTAAVNFIGPQFRVQGATYKGFNSDLFDYKSRKFFNLIADPLFIKDFAAGAAPDGWAVTFGTFSSITKTTTNRPGVSPVGWILELVTSAAQANLQYALSSAAVQAMFQGKTIRVHCLSQFTGGTGVNAVAQSTGGAGGTKSVSSTNLVANEWRVHTSELAVASDATGINFTFSCVGNGSTFRLWAPILEVDGSFYAFSTPTQERPWHPNGYFVGPNGNSVDYGAVAPATLTWKQGDRRVNSSPSVGAPKGWICTVSGTPGTWVSEGNL